MTYEQLLTICAILLSTSIAILVTSVILLRRRSCPSDAEEIIARLNAAADQIDRRTQARMRQLQELLNQARVQVREFKGLDEETPRPLPPDIHAQEDEIMRLAGLDMSEVEIARRLQLSVGEVELTLNLNRPKVVANSR